LLGSFLSLGTGVFGGHGFLAANALSLAVRLFVSAIGAGGSGQGGFDGSGSGFAQNGFGGGFALQAAPVWPACGPGAPLWATGPAPGVYCGPYASQSFGWNTNIYGSGPRIGLNIQ
jgi:hypothetical protein